MVHEGFYDENDEISINATAFTANEPNMGGNSRNLSLTIHTTQHCMKHGPQGIL